MTFYDGIRVSGCVSFSEYWARRGGVDPVDVSVLRLVSSIVSDDAARIAIDVGANLGAFSLAMAKAGFDRVYVFEPVLETYGALIANLRLNPDLAGRIAPERCALAAQPGAVTFEIHPKSPGQNKIAPGNCAGSPTQRCAATTIDRYLSKLDAGSVALLKIDVEGFEGEVLKGADQALRSGRIHFIYSEVIPHALLNAGGSLDEFDNLLSSYGFEPVVISPAAPDHLEPTTLHDALTWAGSRRNVLFRRREH